MDQWHRRGMDVQGCPSCLSRNAADDVRICLCAVKWFPCVCERECVLCEFVCPAVCARMCLCVCFGVSVFVCLCLCIYNYIFYMWVCLCHLCFLRLVTFRCCFALGGGCLRLPSLIDNPTPSLSLPGIQSSRQAAVWRKITVKK